MPWVRVVPSDAVSPGALRSIERADGTAAVVWRTMSGRVVACDARCPHQWSDLGAEGFVDADELVCSAHFWRFSVDGRGTKVNVHGRRDAKADLIVFAVRERDGFIEADLPE